MARDIPLGNGHLLVAYTPQGLIRDVYYPHVGQENHAGGGAFRVGVWEDGKFEWLPDGWQCEVGYLEDTLVTQVVWTHFERGLRLVLNDTVDFHENVHLRKLTVSETAGRKRMLRLFFGFDFSIGGNDIGDTVALRQAAHRSDVHHADAGAVPVRARTLGVCGVAGQGQVERHL